MRESYGCRSRSLPRPSIDCHRGVRPSPHQPSLQDGSQERWQERQGGALQRQEGGRGRLQRDSGSPRIPAEWEPVVLPQVHFPWTSSQFQVQVDAVLLYNLCTMFIILDIVIVLLEKLIGYIRLLKMIFSKGSDKKCKKKYFGHIPESWWNKWMVHLPKIALSVFPRIQHRWRKCILI